MRSKQEIRVGLSISLTGRFSTPGQQALDGIRLWESTTNAQGEMAVRLIYYDDESHIGKAQQNTLKLLREDRVDILFGPYSSALTMAVSQIAEDHKKLLWNHGGSSDEIFNRGHRCLVSTISPASDYLRGLPSWLVKNTPSLRRICLMGSTKGTFAFHLTRGVAEGAGLTGHSVQRVPMDASLGNVDAFVRELHSIRPDVLVLAASFQDEVKIVRQRCLWPGTLRKVAAVAAGVGAFHQELNQAAEGVIGPSQWEPEVRSEQIRGPDSNWFVQNFKERFNQLPDYTAAGGFAVGLLLEECIRKAGSLDDEKLRDVAAELDFNTFYGRFRMDPTTGRQIGHRVLLTEWQQGRKVVLGGWI
jgi:branched-chain amino acid transport system substrate-binding protein